MAKKKAARRSPAKKARSLRDLKPKAGTTRMVTGSGRRRLYIT
jgi:hypothetical protein